MELIMTMHEPYTCTGARHKNTLDLVGVTLPSNYWANIGVHVKKIWIKWSLLFV
jgi:hypothetical protein